MFHGDAELSQCLANRAASASNGANRCSVRAHEPANKREQAVTEAREPAKRLIHQLDSGAGNSQRGAARGDGSGLGTRPSREDRAVS